MARITLTLEVTDEQQAALIDRFLTEARATVSDGDDEDGVAAAPRAGMVDDRGVPWHPDYHAATQTKTAKGEWKKRKGGDAAAIEAYERQYTVPAPAAPAAPAVAAPAAPAVAAPAAPAVAAPQPEVEVPAFLQRTPAPAAPTPPPLPSMPAMPMPVPAPAEAPVTYDDLLATFGEVGARIGNERVASECMRIYGKLGITDVNVLTTDETLRAALVAELLVLK